MPFMPFSTGEGMNFWSPSSAYHRIVNSLPSLNINWDKVIEISSWVLAMSASMILGLLAFSGMYTIWPILPLAFAGLLFSVVIEGEIYFQNILSALEKLRDPKVYENQLIVSYLVEKLENYDKNRDSFLLQEPTEADKKRVRDHNEVVIFKHETGYKIGFKNSENQYEEQILESYQCKFLEHYDRADAPSHQFMEIPGHHKEIQTILQSFHTDIAERPQEKFPLLINAYVSQARYLRQLNCYTHTQVANEARQNELKNMGFHLTKLQSDMTEFLFQDVQPTLCAAQFSLPRKSGCRALALDFKNMNIALNTSTLGGFGNVSPDEAAQAIQDLKVLLDEKLDQISEKTYEFHKNELLNWMIQDRETWKEYLSKHTFNSRVAFLLSAFSGLIMGVGTIYLIMEAVSVIPVLSMLSLALFPPVIAPLALLAGAAYGLLIYNSSTDFLLDNPIQKFIKRARELAAQEMTFKRALIILLSVVLFAITLFLTICNMGTWLTVFHKTKPLFAWLNWVPNLLLNLIIPGLIGASVLPFSIQSVANTLDNMETNPTLDRIIEAGDPRNWLRSTTSWPSSFSEASDWLSERMWQKWVPNFLGITAAEFENETPKQRRNPYRIIYRLLFEPLRQIIFVGHLVSAGATGDQIESVPIFWSFFLNFLFELFEDWDWIMGREHVDDIDTVDLIKERAQNSDDHNHDNNFPMRLLKGLFEPALRRAAQWADDHRDPEKEESNVQARYEKLLGLKSELPTPTIPEYRKGTNFNLFLFKSTMYESAARDNCSVCKSAM